MARAAADARDTTSKPTEASRSSLITPFEEKLETEANTQQRNALPADASFQRGDVTALVQPLHPFVEVTDAGQEDLVLSLRGRHRAPPREHSA